MSRLEEMKDVSCFACHVEILWRDPMCIHNNKSYCRNCYLQVLRKQNQRYKQALEDILNLSVMDDAHKEETDNIIYKALAGDNS